MYLQLCLSGSIAGSKKHLVLSNRNIFDWNKIKSSLDLLLKCKSLEVEALRPVTPNTHHWSPHSAVPSIDWLFHLSAGCYWLWLRSRRCVRGCWFSRLFCGFTEDFVMICIVKEWVVRWYFIHFKPTTSNI